MNKKLDKSLLPQPQKPIGWKRGVLQIATDSRTDLNSSNTLLPTTKYGTTKNNNNGFVNSNNETEQQYQPLKPQSIQYNPTKTFNQQITNRQSRQSITSKPQMGMTASQYSLQQKQLLTFAANQEQDQRNSKYQSISNNLKESQTNFQSSEQKRTNRFDQSNTQSNNNETSRQQSSSVQSSEHNHVNRSSSKNKQHKTSIYRHNLPQNQEFIAYSVVTKQSKSGMFSNQKLLVLNSFKRQLLYYSKLPKLLPFGSYGEMEKNYFINEKPKEVIQFDKVRRFMFVPAKGSLASVAASYVNEKGQRKEWKLGLGHNSLMNEWIELVNEVFKKEHYTVVKSQVKYPPKPKKQPQNKSNNYETKFTKTLKQQVLPVIKQSSIRSSKANDSQFMNQSQLSVSGTKSTANNNLSKSRQKQYVVDSSKFVNTKSYIIDLQDVNTQDIFYEPQPIKQQQVMPKNQYPQQSKIQSSQNNNHQNSQKSINSRYWHGLNESQNGNSRFSQQLQQRQRQINNEHKNRVSTFMREGGNEYNEKQPQQNQPQDSQQPNRTRVPENITPQPIVLTKKPSGQRLSQTTHKDLNIHIDSRIAFGETERQKELAESSYRNDDMSNVANSHVYEPFSRITISNNSNAQQSRIQSNSNNQKSIIQPKPVPFYNQTPEQPRKRVYTQVPAQNYLPNLQPQQQWHKITFQNNSDSMRSSQSSHYQPPNPIKSTSKDKYCLEQPPKNSRTIKQNISSSFMTENSQIQDIIVGGKLHDGYILNFSPYSFGNNWFRLWLETEPANRVQIYASFVRAARTLVKRLIDAPQQFMNCYSLEKNNTHIIFALQNITFKLPFKLPLPQGLGEFISVMDFIRSEDFLAQVFKYQTQIIDQYNNYEYILNQLSTEFNSGVLSLPIYLPMCCLVSYKGISVLCKANMETANLNCYRIPHQQFRRYQKQLQYIEQSCHIRFNPPSSQDNKPFDLYSIHVPSYSKSIIYMDNLMRFLPLMSNPLNKNPNPSMQLNGTYIQGNIKKGMISAGKDIEQIEKHLMSSVIKRFGEEIVAKARKIVSGKQLDELLYRKSGLRVEYLGTICKRVQEKQQKSMAKSYHASSLILTEILLAQYSKACQLYFMKEYFKQLYASMSNASQQSKFTNANQRLNTSQASNNSKTIKNLQTYTSVSSTFGQSYSLAILEILHYLIYRNSKVWTVLSVALDEKYGISEFRKLGSQRQVIQALMSRVNMQYMVLGLLDKLGVQVEIKSWANNMSWGTLPLTEDNLSLSPYSSSQCYPLKLFNPQYHTLISQLQQISTSRSFSAILSQKNYFIAILQVLNISQQSYENQTSLIKSAAYQLLEYSFPQQRQLIDFSLSYFIPTSLKDTKSTKAISSKQKSIDLYQKLLDQQLVRSSKDVSVMTFEVNFNGIKWLIKQNQYELAQVLIQEQLQAISIWYTEGLLQTKCKFLDLAATFYHKKLSNRNNLAIDYAIKSLQIAMDNKAFLPLSICAEKCFQAANIHFDCGLIEKSLELYELAQDFIFQSERNKTLSQTDLSIEFLKIYLRKAEIKLAMGKKNQTLYECLECLRKCQQFEDLLNADHNNSGEDFVHAQRQKEQLAELEINVFLLIFRCYQVTKNLPDMQRIAQLCSNKFIQDKVLILRMNKPLRNKNLQDSINPSLMSKLLKMCWTSIINKLAFNTVKPSHQNEQPLNKTMTISSTLTRKSFCLSGALSQPPKKPPQLNHYQKLEELMEKLQALCKLYPKSRYDKETLSMFVCREVVEASTKMNIEKGMGRGEYQLIGGRKKGLMSGRVEEMISSAKGENEGQVMSVLYERLWQVIRELTDISASRSSKRIQRYQTQSSSYHQRRGSRQKPRYYQSIETHQNYPQTSTKKQPSKFYHSPEVFTSEFDQQNSQDQPQLRMSFILGRQEGRREQNISTYDIYSLKDQMDKKYMLMEAIFGLCGREFVLGLLQEAIDNQKRKLNGPQGCKVFYE